jgi:hypothetical protein
MNARTLFATALATLLAACGSSSTSTSTSSGNARMTVRLVDAPTAAYEQVLITVQDVQIQTDAGWKVLGTVNKTVDLLALQNGAFLTLAQDAELPPGHYGQMRLTLSTEPGAINRVVFSKDSYADLTIPSGFQTGIKIPASFDLQAGTTYEIFVDMDANKSIFVHQAGASGKYMLRPVVHAYDRMRTGTISGTLAIPDLATATRYDVQVIAQTVGSDAQPSFARSVTAGKDGKYTLSLLPIDKTYFVAVQPVVYSETTTWSYAPKASPGIPLNTTTPTGTWNETFTGGVIITGTGRVSGPVLTVAQANQYDVAQARLPVAAGGGPLIVRSSEAVVTEDSGETPVSETYAFEGLPPSALYSDAGYSFAIERFTTVPGTYDVTVKLSPVKSQAVSAGSDVILDFLDGFLPLPPLP